MPHFRETGMAHLGERSEVLFTPSLSLPQPGDEAAAGYVLNFTWDFFFFLRPHALFGPTRCAKCPHISLHMCHVPTVIVQNTQDIRRLAEK